MLNEHEGTGTPLSEHEGMMTMEIEWFATPEEAAKRLDEAMKAADAKAQPWQAALEPGDCFVMETEGDFLIFGEVLEGSEPGRCQHYRFCRCSSVACPEGELGDVHVSAILSVIDRELFEGAREKGWRLNDG